MKTARFLVATAIALTTPVASVRDPCLGLGDQVNTFSSFESVYACLNSFPIGSAEMVSTVTNVKKILDLYPYMDLVQGSTSPLFPSNIDLLSSLDGIAASSISVAFEFHTKVTFLLNSVYDSHMLYTPLCFKTLFQFVQPWHIAATYPANSPKPVLKLRGTHLKESMRKDAFQLWRDALDGKTPLDYDGYTIVSIDGMDPVDAVQAYADKYSGYGKEANSRFNNVLMFPWYSLGSYILKPGSFYTTPFLGYNASPIREYRLKSPSGSETTLRVPWIAYNLKKIRSQHTLQALCTLNGKTSDESDPVDNGDMRDLEQFDEIDDEADFQDQLDVLPKIKIDWSRSTTSRSRALEPIPPFDLYRPLYSDRHNAFYILEDRKVGVWVISTFTIKGEISEFYPSWVANVTTGLIGLQNRGATKLILDVSGNKGGVGCVSRVFANYLLSGTNPLLVDFRATDAMKALWKTSFFGKGLSLLKPYPSGTEIRDVKTVTRAGKQSRFSGYFVTKCAATNGTVEYPPLPRKYTPNDIAIVSNGNCGSACSLMIRALRDTWKVPAYVYGGATKTTFTPTSYEGGFVTSLRKLNAHTVDKEDLSASELALLPSNFPNSIQFRFAIMEAFSPNGKQGLNNPIEWTPSPAEEWLDVEDPSDTKLLWNAVAKKRWASSGSERFVILGNSRNRWHGLFDRS
ncbi:hypothetical protein HDU97_002601 [Phlyctochytrium planicorne]|nr:hypothetical protein HDU97_002601 [Phlyctochytrium planicorne]